jgi:hypothetical protein
MLVFSLLTMSASAGVNSGDQFTTLDGGTVTVDSKGGIFGDYTTRFTDGVGRSAGSPATPTPGGCAGEVDYSGEGTTYGEGGSDGGDTGDAPRGGTYRVGLIDGQPPKPGGCYQRDDSGKWRRLKRKPGKKGADHPGACSQWDGDIPGDSNTEPGGTMPEADSEQLNGPPKAPGGDGTVGSLPLPGAGGGVKGPDSDNGSPPKPVVMHMEKGFLYLSPCPTGAVSSLPA